MAGRAAAALRTVVCVAVSLAFMVISDGWQVSSLTVAAEDCPQLAQPGLHPPEIADVSPIDCIRVMTKMAVGKLLQQFQLGVDGGGAGEVGVEGGCLAFIVGSVM